MGSFAPIIASQLNIKVSQVQAVLDLFDEAATIPFIARYRKDKTGGLDEVQIQQIEEASKFLKTFTERKEFIEKAITEQGKMTDELQKKLDAATTLAALEDIYLPYKPKRKTKAQTAKENGLERLSIIMLAQGSEDIEQIAAQYLNDKITTSEEALSGARDIIAELINENDIVRAKMRLLFEQTACIQTKVLTDKETEGIKYKDYFDFSEPIHKIPSHRTMAILRGFLEGVLRMSIAPVEEDALTLIESIYLGELSPWREHVKKSIKDAYRRLLQPSLETEYRTSLKQKADEEAINVFAENLRQLLLSAPLGSKKILAIDPGYRTGCKVVCLDEKGMLQQTELIYIHENNRLDQSEHTIRSLVKSYGI
ncbi:MAG: RNA-binding transcriptional accessory protein, partial [Bacteroidetes bacterium]|nr:RNA-binding transcriptional accessory protein [Bacteroidota bacterium]